MRNPRPLSEAIPGGTTTSASGGGAGAVENWQDGSDISLLTLVNLLLRRRQVVLLTMLTSFIAGVLILLLQHPTYTSYASFMPQQSGRSDVSRFSGLAAQFGVSLPAGSSAQPPYFYVDLLQSHELLGAAVDKRYLVPTADKRRPRTLIDLFDSPGATPADRRENAINRLREQAVPSVQLKSGLISLSVTTRYPDLSKQVADTLLGLLNEFNIQSRRTQYAAERQFAEERLEEVRSDVRQAEQKLRAFLEQNRQGASSPRLLFERESLERELELQRQLALSLAQSFEQARLEEFRDTPLIIVVEQPDRPVHQDSRHFMSRSLVAALIGLAFGAALALLLDAIAFVRASTSPAVVEFRALLARALRRPLRESQ